MYNTGHATDTEIRCFPGGRLALSVLLHRHCDAGLYLPPIFPAPPGFTFQFQPCASRFSAGQLTPDAILLNSEGGSIRFAQDIVAMLTDSVQEHSIDLSGLRKPWSQPRKYLSDWPVQA